MTERYPDDATVLALESDAATGVEYIPTGQSPYYLHFRKLLQRLLLATCRANDLRVYQDGDLSIGVRSGRCLIHNTPIAFTGTEFVGVTNNAVTHVWLDNTGSVQTGTSGLPTDRTDFLPLAEVTADAGAITQIIDLRGEAFLAVTDPTQLGLTATAAQINQALDGIDPQVDAAALNTLTAGLHSTADDLHRHEILNADVDDEAEFRVRNENSGGSANATIGFDLPGRLPAVTTLLVDMNNGFLRQRFAGTSHALVGTVHPQYVHAGDLAASQTGRLIGCVPVDGQVSDVILSLGENIESDQSADGIAATVSVNGTALCTVDPSITDAAGAGFRSTAQGNGTEATVKTDGTEQVTRGDVLTVNLTRTVSGTVSNEAADAVVLVVIRADAPE